MSDAKTTAHLLTTREAARRLRLATGTLHNWRIRGQGPEWVRLGKAVRYEPESLARFIAQGRTTK